MQYIYIIYNMSKFTKSSTKTPRPLVKSAFGSVTRKVPYKPNNSSSSGPSGSPFNLPSIYNTKTSRPPVESVFGSVTRKVPYKPNNSSKFLTEAPIERRYFSPQKQVTPNNIASAQKIQRNKLVNMLSEQSIARKVDEQEETNTKFAARLEAQDKNLLPTNTVPKQQNTALNAAQKAKTAFNAEILKKLQSTQEKMTKITKITKDKALYIASDNLNNALLQIILFQKIYNSEGKVKPKFTKKIIQNSAKILWGKNYNSNDDIPKEKNALNKLQQLQKEASKYEAEYRNMMGIKRTEDFKSLLNTDPSFKTQITNLMKNLNININSGLRRTNLTKLMSSGIDSNIRIKLQKLYNSTNPEELYKSDYS